MQRNSKWWLPLLSSHHAAVSSHSQSHDTKWNCRTPKIPQDTGIIPGWPGNQYEGNDDNDLVYA